MFPVLYLEGVRDWVESQLMVLLSMAQTWVTENIPDIILGLLIVLIGYRLSKTAGKYAGRPVYQWVNRQSIARTIIRLIRYIVLGVSVLISLRVVFGITLTSFLLTATVFSAVAGIILAPLVGDIISGIFVLGDQPYEIGDMIEIVDTGQRGFVDDVTIRYTKIFTMDNTFLIIPNSEIRKRDVNNFSAEDVRTRQLINLSITYESDLDKAMEIMEEAAKDAPEVISTRGTIRIGKADYPLMPTAFVEEFGDHGISLKLRYWTREPFYLPAIRSKINQMIWREFKENDVTIPYPHRHHIFDDTTGTMDISMDKSREK